MDDYTGYTNQELNELDIHITALTKLGFEVDNKTQEEIQFELINRMKRRIDNKRIRIGKQLLKIAELGTNLTKNELDIAIEEIFEICEIEYV